MAGRMYFDSDKAFNFLRTRGHVFTLRKAPAKDQPRVLQTITIWRHGEGLGRWGASLGVTAKRLRIAEGFGISLNAYVGDSGFGSVEEWVEEISRLHKGQQIKNPILYYVHEVRG